MVCIFTSCLRACQEQEKREKEVASLQESLNELTTQIEDISVTTKNLSLGIQHVSSTFYDIYTCVNLLFIC